MRHVPIRALVDSHSLEEKVKHSRVAGRLHSLWLERSLAIIFGLVEGLLIIRVVLRLLEADPSGALVKIIYPITYPLIAPFQSFFPTPRPYGSVLEFSSLTALVVSLVLSYGLARLIMVIRSGQREVRRG